MKRSILFSLVFLLISACGPSQKPPDAKPNLTDVPVNAPPAATDAISSEVPSPSPSPEPTATTETERIIFQDNFLGFLDENWQWLNEDPANWSLEAVPGSLQITIENGFLNLKNASNVLLQTAPEGNFQLETSLNFPKNNRTHFAGLLLYESEKNFIQAGHAYCNPVNRCVGDGIYLEEYNQGIVLTDPYVAQKYDQDNVYLRLIYRDGLLVFLVSPDGSAWYRISASPVNFDILQVGLVASQNLKDPSPVTFDYFQIKALK